MLFQPIPFPTYLRCMVEFAMARMHLHTQQLLVWTPGLVSRLITSVYASAFWPLQTPPYSGDTTSMVIPPSVTHHAELRYQLVRQCTLSFIPYCYRLAPPVTIPSSILCRENDTRKAATPTRAPKNTAELAMSRCLQFFFQFLNLLI